MYKKELTSIYTYFNLLREMIQKTLVFSDRILPLASQWSTTVAVVSCKIITLARVGRGYSTLFVCVCLCVYVQYRDWKLVMLLHHTVFVHLAGAGRTLYKLSLKSNETSSVKEPHSNLCQQLAEIAVTLLVSLLFKPVTTGQHPYMQLVPILYIVKSVYKESFFKAPHTYLLKPSK